MRFKCGMSLVDRRASLMKWHCWYAWFPVRVGPHDFRWLEPVWRLGGYWRDDFMSYTHRAIDDPPKVKRNDAMHASFQSSVVGSRVKETPISQERERIKCEIAQVVSSIQAQAVSSIQCHIQRKGKGK